MGKVSETNIEMKLKISKIESEQLDKAIAVGHGLSRPDLCRQALKQYLLYLDLPGDNDPTIIKGDKTAKLYHIHPDNRGKYRCDITHAICDCIVTSKDCRTCVVPLEHQQSTKK